MIKLLLIVLSLFFTIQAFTQLKPNEKPDIIYDTRPRAFKRTTYRLNGNVLNSKQLRSVLLNNERSAPLFMKGRKQHVIGLPIALGGIVLMQAGFSKASEFGVRDRDKKTNAYLLSGAGILVNIFGDVILYKGSRNKRNAINAFNQISLMEKPSNQKDTTKNSKSIQSNSRYMDGNQYFLNGQKASIKTIDNTLSKSEKAKPFYLPLQKNKKIRNIAGIATGVFLTYPFIFRAKDLNTPMSEIDNRGLMWVSLTGILVAGTTTGISDKNVKEYRYNAYRVFNDEIPYPFNRRQEKIIDGVSKVKMGFGNYGYGFLVRL